MDSSDDDSINLQETNSNPVKAKLATFDQDQDNIKT